MMRKYHVRICVALIHVSCCSTPVDSSANTFPYIDVQNSNTRIEHEASTSRIAEEQLFYLLQRGITMEEAVALMVNGFCKEVFNELPLEFASEADRLLSLKLEGSIG